MATCTRYELDVSGKRFGDCKCGHAKTEHSDAALHAPHQPAQAPAAAAAAPVVQEQYHGPCDHFNVDISASEFGLCKCGFKKIDHGKPKEQFTTKSADAAPIKPAPSPPPVEKPPASAEKPPAPPSRHAEAAEHKKAAQPCNHFEIDVTGTFGFCKCGFSREDHKNAGTFVEAELRVFAGGHITDSKRATIVSKPGQHPGKQAKPCDHYQVDTGGQTFGDCMCGHAKTKHKQFQAAKKTHNNNPDEEEVVPEPEPEAPRVIVRDGVHPCEIFELDMKNSGGYGHCICGFSRLDHEQFHHDPQDWVRVKDALTAPKEFT